MRSIERDPGHAFTRHRLAAEADFRLIVPLVRWINGVLGLHAATQR